MIGRVLRNLARLALTTEPGRRLLELAATADEEQGRVLLERLAARYHAKLEIWE